MNEPSDDALNFLLRRSLMDAKPMTDDERENAIAAESLKLCAMSRWKTDARRESWERLKALIAGRSAKKVRELEEEKGLR